MYQEIPWEEERLYNFSYWYQLRLYLLALEQPMQSTIPFQITALLYFPETV